MKIFKQIWADEAGIKQKEIKELVWNFYLDNFLRSTLKFENKLKAGVCLLFNFGCSIWVYIVREEQGYCFFI